MAPNHLLDHVVVAVRDLDQAIQDYRDLGFSVLRGGVHANGATHNALICFANGTYIELLAPTGSTPLPNRIDFSTLLLHGEGLAGFALGTMDLEADVARLAANGIAAGPIVPGERQRGDGTLIRWTLAQIEGGFAPFLIQDLTPHSLRVPDTPDAITHTNRVTGLRGIQIRVPSIDATARRYAPIVALAPPVRGQIDLVTGRIRLLESLHAPREVLEAVELLGEQSDQFPEDKTHGVHSVPRTSTS